MLSSRLVLTGRLAVVLLSLVAVFVVSAVGAASASAHFFAVCETRGSTEARWSNSECTERGGTEKFATKELASEEVEGESEAGETAELAGTVASEKITIGCGKTAIETGKGTVETGGKTKATIVYSKCALYKTSTGKEIEKCEVANITAKVKGALEETSGELEVKLEPETGSIFAEITISGSTCLEKVSKAAVEGSQKCHLPGHWGFQRLHLIHCLASGSSLKFDKEAATYRGLFSLRLRRGLPWGTL